MKIEQLREKLRINNKVRPLRTFADTFGEKKIFDVMKLKSNSASIFEKSIYPSEEYPNTMSEMKIIGVTGSHGKSSVAYLIHSYLKEIGFKSVLYSSISIDSPASFTKENEAVENPLRDEQMLLNAIEEAIAFNADFLVLEVNERAINKGLTKDIPFNLRIITNINPTHNTFFYPNYVEIKKRFFEEVNLGDDVVCIFSANDKDIFNSLYEANSKKKITYMSKYVKEKRGIDTQKIDYLLTANKTFDSINGLEFTVETQQNAYDVKTNLIFPHNGLNITCVIASLEALKVFDAHKFGEMIKSVVVPGTDEVFKYQDKTIIITRSISPILEYLNKYQLKNEINDIHLVMGSAGLGFKTWRKEFSDEAYIKEKEYSVKFAYDYANKYANKIYITLTDSGATNQEQLLEYQYSYVDENIPTKKFIDRSEAIISAITSANSNDVIVISGRGNRRIMCDTYDNRKLHLDSDEVKSVIKKGL